jgi:anti-anti-sigma factor
MTRPGHFSLAETVLTVHGDLGVHEEREFDKLLRQLVATGGSDLCLDLRDVNYISSTYIGVIVANIVAVTQKSAELVVLASPQVHKVLKMARVEQLGSIRLCQG